jgi:hypothetical protein
MEEQYSLVKEPLSCYIGHVTPSSVSGEDISESIYNYVTDEVPGGFNSVLVLGCDGTPVNTGVHNGVLRLLELKLGKSVQWVVCLLHFNELPLRHLFQFLDSRTSGPSSYSDCELLPLVKFEPINCTLSSIDLSILSKDQKYLMDIAIAISSGNCPADLAIRNP